MATAFDEGALGLHRGWGGWRGVLPVDGGVPLVLRGGWRRPRAEAVAVALGAVDRWDGLRDAASRALDAEAAAAGLPPPGKATVHHALVERLAGRWTLEIGLSSGADEEHLLGARFRDHALVELCGSVPRP